MAETKIKALFIFEILGKPPEHIKETLFQVINKLEELPGIEITKKQVHEPKLLEDKNTKDLFTTFAEAEVTGENLDSIVNIVFHGMPSHVEIIEPEELKIKNIDISGLLSSLTVKLHRYDEIAKVLTMEKNMLIRKLREAGVNLSENKEQDKKEIPKVSKKVSKPEKRKTKKRKF